MRTIEGAIIRMKQIYKYISIIDSTSPSIEFERKKFGKEENISSIFRPRFLALSKGSICRASLS